MLVQEALEEYRFAILRLSPQTQEWYIDRLSRFSQWCNEHDITLEKVKPIETRKYIEHLRTTPSQKTGEVLSSAAIVLHL